MEMDSCPLDNITNDEPDTVPVPNALDMDANPQPQMPDAQSELPNNHKTAISLAMAQ